ncbi:MAG: SUF system NifU family Fe-S cluster assembly protein [Vicinamibacteraceae bacterium]|nr:SUF system NifU family Fe-S cluster assembly protein [Vicinamibacteraceae bacterium]
MSELRDLYQEVILDHNKRPRNFGRLEHPTHQANGHNPLCGDRLTLTLRLEDGRIADIRFDGSGCAISKASASLMTDAVKGRSIEEADRLFADVHAMVTGEAGHEVDVDRLGKLAVLSGVAEFPARVKCASLAWHTLEAALHHAGAEVSTESETQ